MTVAGRDNMVLNNAKECFCSSFIIFQRILESRPHFPRQHSAAFGCTTNYYQPAHCTLRLCTRIALRALKVSHTEGGIAVNCEKNTIFHEHPADGRVDRKWRERGALIGAWKCNLPSFLGS